MLVTRSLKVKEYEETEVPQELLTEAGEISAFPGILQKDYFSVRYKKGKAVLQAGGYVGVIPVNASLSLDISPKVPISNLERIVFLANHQPSVLKEYRRRYSPHQFSSGSLTELLCDLFLLAVEEVCSTGLLKLYTAVASTGFCPRGRIDIQATFRERARSRDSRVSSIAHRRGVDFAPNQLLKNVLYMLLRDGRLMGSRVRRRKIVELLTHLEPVANVDSLDALMADPLVERARDWLPFSKQSYLDAISLAKVLAGGKGVTFLGAGEIGGGSLVLNLEKAFEGYVLAVLLEAPALKEQQFLVLDGNKSSDFGGKKALFSPSLHPSYIKKEVLATPDILVHCRDARHGGIVIDVKYKSVSGLADRSDLNQIIAYACSYGSVAGVLVLPSSKDSGAGLRSVGSIQGIEFYMYFINIGAESMEDEEGSFAAAMAGLMSQ